MRDLNRIHLNGLRAIEAVGRLGSLHAAAEEIGVTPGAVSQQVIKSERQLGRDLFDRTAGGLRPTEFGRMVLPQLSEGFRSLDQAVRTATRRTEDSLTVSVAPVLAAKWLVPRLARFRAAQPAIRVRLDASTEMVDLDGSDVDLAIRLGHGDWPGLKLRRLLSHSMFPICSPGMVERLRTPRDLLDMPVVYDAGSPGSWDPWLGQYGMTERSLSPGDSFTDAGLCLDAVIAGQGVMIAWQTLAADALAAGLIARPFPGIAASGRDYFVATSQRRPETAPVRAFIGWLAAEMAETARRFGE